MTTNDSRGGAVMRRAMPTLRELGDYLSRLGFVHRDGVFEGRPIHIYEHPTIRPPRFRLPGYPMDQPLRGWEIEPVQIQLNWNGFIPDMTFNEFIAQFAPAKAG